MMKEKIEGELSKKGREWGEVKLGKGSIRDIEFVTQYLHGMGCEVLWTPSVFGALV